MRRARPRPPVRHLILHACHLNMYIQYHYNAVLHILFTNTTHLPNICDFGSRFEKRIFDNDKQQRNCWGGELVFRSSLSSTAKKLSIGGDANPNGLWMWFCKKKKFIFAY